MSGVSQKLEALAETHRVNPLVILEWWLERASIREYEGGYSRAEAERLALADVEAELSNSPRQINASQREGGSL